MNRSIIMIPMQFFAEGEGGQPAGQDTQPAAGQEPQGGDQNAEPKLDEVLGKFKAEDILGSEIVKKALQSHTDKQITKALETAKLKWHQEQLDALDESRKLEKMTAAEREKYQFEKEKKEFEQKKAEFERAQLKVTVGSELQKRGLSADFAAYLTGANAESSKANIDAFEKLFNEAVQTAANERLKGGKPPKDNASNGAGLSGVEAAFLAKNPGLKI